MAFDKTTRNRLATFVKDARECLAGVPGKSPPVPGEFGAQLQELYGISAAGDITPMESLAHLDETGLAIAARLRERIAYLVAAHPEGKNVHAEAVARLAREQAFTVLNRLAAVRMAEQRGLIVESVGKGFQSRGFRVFESVAGSGLGDTFLRYRQYLFCLFDELALDLPVLFDRRAPQSLLFPREKALTELLGLINAPELESLWTEDETIGWIYQYYNDEAERKKMREESSAPRNSRELAVRNQFFTPRYVVEFLTDNTLGRLWYEMTKGATSLQEQCRYLVRRPAEIFLEPGEPRPECAAGSEAGAKENFSQEELLRQPVHIPHRPLKDPREIRLLDPACGSMHFGLYAFDLFEVIYSGAWDIAKSGSVPAGADKSFSDFCLLTSDFSSKEEFLRQVPRLIVERNIHGIDIDPRAAQIAGLSLWLRAQRAWHQAGVKPADRPRITRSNLVCAEPMPGEKELLREFVEQQFPAGERPAFAFLLEKIFDRMTLAGEAGSLLRIEGEIRTAIAEAKRRWKEDPKQEQRALFPEIGAKSFQGEMLLDLSGITDEQFWEHAEQRIYDALEAYAGQAENGGGFQRRLFADDAAQGFAFIDLCRKHYDVAVMNPPFGEYPSSSKEYYYNSYPDSKNDLIGMFIERCVTLSRGGFVGAISSRTIFFLTTFSPLRSRRFLEDDPPLLVADLGKSVMDNAMVEAAAYCITAGSRQNSDTLFFNVLDAPERETTLTMAVKELWAGRLAPMVIPRRLALFAALESSPFCYWAAPSVLTLFKTCDRLESPDRPIRVGLQTGDDFRYIRCRWEIPSGVPSWVPHPKGGETVRFAADVHLCVNWADNGAEIRSDSRARVQNEAFYFRAGITSSYRCLFYSPAIFPSGMITGVAGSAIYVSPADAWWILGLGNSQVFDSLIKLRLGSSEAGIIQVGHLQNSPLPRVSNEARATLANSARMGWHRQMNHYINLETSAYYLVPINGCVEVGTDDILRDLGSAASAAYGVSIHEFATLAEAKDEGGQSGKFDETEAPRSQVSYAVGVVFGRWDVRYATGERPAPELPDPFAPLPVCPPGMLQGDDGLPLSPEAGRRLRTEGRYPLDVAWDGILVDDPEHPLDLERRVHAALAVLWGDRADALEHEACALLGVPTLREWFRRPAGFFADHLKRYSKSRRQAPIYWPLSTASGSYTLWIYYHRLTDQTLDRCLADFVEPKIRDVQKDLDRQRTEGRGQKAGELQEFLDELCALRDELERIIKLPWKPNLNDGVLITASPLWKLFRHSKWQKDLKACWEELEGEEYEWAHLAYSIWPQRVEKVCEKDRSIAIAHGLEHLCKVEPPKPKAKKKGKKKASAKAEADQPELMTED